MVRLGQLLRALGAVLLLVVGCVDAVGLGGYTDATEDLCGVLAGCFGEAERQPCLSHASAKLEAASTQERQAWLEIFADGHCAESCVNAQACLDLAPLCGTLGSVCARSEQCCGFSWKRAACVGDRCCVPQGASCAAGERCCGGLSCSSGLCSSPP